MIPLNDDTRWILGRPNFVCGGIAAALRRLGHPIREKAEDEQAEVIHWMLSLYEEHGADWNQVAAAVLTEARASAGGGSDRHDCIE
jgi:hypothetical protein